MAVFRNKIMPNNLKQTILPEIRHNDTGGLLFGGKGWYWAPNEHNELPEMSFKFPTVLIGKMIMAF